MPTKVWVDWSRFMLKYAAGLLALVLIGCTSAQPAPTPEPGPKIIEGMWSDPPATIEGRFCTFSCTDAGLERLNALLDDPANDARSYNELRTEAAKYEQETYFVLD